MKDLPIIKASVGKKRRLPNDSILIEMSNVFFLDLMAKKG